MGHSFSPWDETYLKSDENSDILCHVGTSPVTGQDTQAVLLNDPECLQIPLTSQTCLYYWAEGLDLIM